MLKSVGLLIFFIPLIAGSQGYYIEINIEDAANSDLVLANYYLDNVYARDTVKLDSEGRGVFMSGTLLPEGLYKIYQDQNKHFDILIGEDQRFSLTKKSFNSDDGEINGSEETRAFFDYTGFLGELQKRNSELRKKIENPGSDNKEELRTELEGLTGELHKYWDKIEEELPNSFLSGFVRANYLPSPQISEIPAEIQENDSLLMRYRYYFQREHFWDYFDYKDERFLYTPFYKTKLEKWFTKVLYPDYDSVYPYVIAFIEDIKPQKKVFQFVTSWFLNSSINSNIMGMDALFVDIARKYYLSGEAFWATEESMNKIRENLLFTEKNLIGMNAPDLTLESIEGNYINLYQIAAPYTIVLIFEPDCSHCNEFVPRLYSEVYLKYRDRGLEVYAVYSMSDKKKWEDFLDRYGLKEWINVWDEHHVSGFKVLYDARYTPGVYLLDQNKKIVAKKMSIQQIISYLELKLI